MLAPEEKYQDVLKAFMATGKVWFTEDKAQVQKLRDVVFPGGHLNKDVVGKSPRQVGAMAGIDVPETARIILAAGGWRRHERRPRQREAVPGRGDPSLQDLPGRCRGAKANLILEGAGHSAALHSNNEANIRSAGVELPVSRLVVNQASSFTAGGSLTNGFAPTTTLGCGSWGGNSISENLDYKHLMNVSRIGKVIANKKVPTDAEIWA